MFEVTLATPSPSTVETQYLCWAVRAEKALPCEARNCSAAGLVRPSMAFMASASSTDLFIPGWSLYRSGEMPNPEPARMLTDLLLGPTGRGAIPTLKFAVPDFSEERSKIMSQGPS